MENEVWTLEELGLNIRRYREKQGLSQNQLAATSGLHRNYVSDVERGTRNISFEALMKISKGLNVPMRKLFKKDF